MNFSLRIVLLWLLLGVLFPGLSAQVTLSPQVDSIPMRDSKVLAADTYLPAGNQARPTILVQTPYNRLFYRFGLPLNVEKALDSSPFNFVILDWRGFYGSTGAFVAGANRGEDGFDAVEWIAAQPWSDGQIATWGPSALGVVQFQTMREQPPHLVCAVPLVAEPSFNYEEYYPGGVYRTEYIGQLDGLGFGLSTILQANPVYNQVWTFAEAGSFYPQDIAVPVFMEGGWYDHNIEHSLTFFAAMRQQSAAAVRDQHQFLIGPWAHGGFGDTRPGTINQGELSFPGAEGWVDSLAVLFLRQQLLGENNGWDSRPPIQYYQMGDNAWRETESWPPAGNSEEWVLQMDSSLALAAGSSGSLSVRTDPRDPSPTIGGMTLQQDLLQGPYDQRDEVESRDDILLFNSAPLSQAVQVQGQIEVKLFVSTDRPDGDVAIRLMNVYPDGRSVLLLDDILRLRFREGYRATDTMATVPGEVYEISLLLSDLAHTFLPGHRIRLGISGSNYPRYDLNLNNGGPMYTAGDSLISVMNIHLGANTPSRLIVPVGMPNSRGEEVALRGIEVFPNPAKTAWEIAGSSSERVEVRLFDLQGRLLATKAGQFPLRLERGQLPIGVYVLEIRQGNQLGWKKLWAE